MLVRNDCVPDLYKKKSSRARVACGNRLSNFGFRKPIKSKSLHQSSSGILLALDVVDQISWKIKLVRHFVDQGRQSDTQDVSLAGVYLTGVHLIGVHLIYESSLRVGHGWRKSLCRHPGWLRKLLIVGDSAVRLLVTLGARSAW